MFDKNQLKQRLLEMYKIVSEYYDLLNTDTVNFFNENQWLLVPIKWRAFLHDLTDQQLAHLIDCNNNCVNFSIEMPNSLKKVRIQILQYSLQRKPNEFMNIELKHLDEESETFLRALLAYKCKRKKFTEILQMGQVCFQSACKQKVDFVMDIGSGLGHLSRCLTYFYDIPVIAIEMDAEKTRKAKVLDAKFSRQLDKRKMAKSSIRRPIIHLTKTITPQMSLSEFNDLIEPYYSIGENKCTFGLVGLHPCGNLAPTMMRLFTESSNCRFLNLASCCYNKMTIVHEQHHEQHEQDRYRAFPLNDDIGTSIILSERQLGLSLHALESFQERLVENVESFKAEFYRALTEKVILEKLPHFRDIRRRNVRTTGPNAANCFVDYLQCSLKGLRLDEALKNYANELESQSQKFRQVVAFTVIKNMFAPLLETIVILDRVLYLLSTEHTSCQVIRCFDTTTSPRVHVINAYKRN